MQNKLLLITGALGATLAQTASAQLSLQNFDSYADTAALHSGGDTVGSSGWTASVGAGLTLDGSRSVTSPNSVTQGNTAATADRKTYTSVAGNEIHVAFNFYDSFAGLERTYGRVESRVGTTYAGGLNQLAAIGKNNNIATTKYNGRVAFATGAVYSDGAANVTATWFTLDGAADRSIGWHSAEIIGAMDDPTHMSLSFYIDGLLGGKVSNIANADFNWIVLGSGLAPAAGGTGVSFDDVSVQVVPEPSTIALGLLGGAGLMFGYFRRRAK